MIASHCAQGRDRRALHVISVCSMSAGSDFCPTGIHSLQNSIVIYADGMARETIHFIAGLLGDQKVLLLVEEYTGPQ
jgi:hypothetical protein